MAAHRSRFLTTSARLGSRRLEKGAKVEMVANDGCSGDGCRRWWLKMRMVHWTRFRRWSKSIGTYDELGINNSADCSPLISLSMKFSRLWSACVTHIYKLIRTRLIWTKLIDRSNTFRTPMWNGGHKLSEANNAHRRPLTVPTLLEQSKSTVWTVLNTRSGRLNQIKKQNGNLTEDHTQSKFN